MVSQIGFSVHCNTGSLRKHKPSARFISLSNNYVTVKACSRNITGSTNLAYRLSFQGLPLFLDKEKSAECTYFATWGCFIHPPLIFATQSLITSLQHVKIYIGLLNQSLWTLCITYCYERSSLIVRVILQRWSIKTLFFSSLRR